MMSFFVGNIFSSILISLLATVLLVAICIVLPKVCCKGFKLRISNYFVIAIATVIFLFNTFLFAGAYQLKVYIQEAEQNIGTIKELLDKYPALTAKVNIVDDMDVQQGAEYVLISIYEYINSILLKSGCWITSALLITIMLFIYWAQVQERKRNQSMRKSSSSFDDFEF